MQQPYEVLRRHRDAAATAQANYQNAFRARFPVGAAISWDRGQGSRQSGHVTLWSYGDRLKVCNERTRAEYWITMGDVLR